MTMSVIMDSAVGQQLRSTERISSFSNKFENKITMTMNTRHSWVR